MSGCMILLLLATAQSAAAAGQEPTGSAQDVIFQGDLRPVLLRLHVEVDGRPFRALWQEYLDKLFADLDRDGDGALSPAEAARVPDCAFLRAFLQGELRADNATPAVSFDVLDTDRDGRVSRGEFKDYYLRAGLDAMVLQVLPRRPEVEAVSDALFRILDRNGDGKLSRQELADANASLHKVDLDEDELITRDELLAAGTAMSRRPTPANPSPFSFAISPLAASGPRADVREEQKPADAELTLCLGAPSVHPGQEQLISLERNILAVRVAPRAQATFQGMQQFYLQQFHAADANRKGYLERGQATAYLNGLFTLADRDGDGKLTAAELKAFLDLHACGAQSFITLTALDQGIGLFELLDADGDGRLSPRELNAAWSRLCQYDRDGIGSISKATLPRRHLLWLSRGWPSRAALTPAAESKPKTTARGPLWFQNMDNNGDGDVSRREFLGSDEEFRRLDTDGDGLISAAEAIRNERLKVKK